MPVLSIPFVFTNGTTADGNQVDADFNTVQNVVNGLDFANVGVNGFFANQIIPTTLAQATFGGSVAYNFPSGLSVTGTLSTSGGLTISSGGLNVTGTVAVTGNETVSGSLSVGPNGVSSLTPGNVIFGQSATAGQIQLGGSSTSAAIDFNITAATTVTINRATAITGNGTVSGALNVGPVGSVAVAGDAAFARSTSTGLILLGGSVSSVQLDWNISNAAYLNINKQVAVAGPITSQRGGSASYGAVAPMFNNAGGGPANTLHMVEAQVTGTGAAVTVNLTGASVFANSASYVVFAQDVSAGGTAVAVTAMTATSFTLAAVTSGHLVNYFAIGT